MARFRFSVIENRGVGASRTQQQEQEQQRGDTEADRNTGLRALPPALALPAFQDSNGSGNGLRPPVLPPALALPAFQGSNGSGNGLVRYETSEDNREELQEHIHRDLEEIRRELDSVEEELK
ncbi:hypothetical protein OIU74_020089 [Salix koriyanagi]|uniref:Uncharacterized protein n=1 Tax=Salix koriyanagi TaxID=2511006 RepID=A0A9Q0P548_9ROSI|nr:hypothetical protein OIU74_020089 [Salix koriyanagi]